MTPDPESPAEPDVTAGRAAWRVAVVGEADRLQHRLDAVEEASSVHAAQVQRIHQILQQARRTATIKEHGKTLADWWFGTSIESAWQKLHLAQEEFVLLQSETALRAQVPRLQVLARIAFGADQAKDETQTLQKWISSPHAATPDALVAHRILAAYHAKSDAHHQQVRNLRNLLYEILAVIIVLVTALWVADLTSGAVLGLGALAGALSVVFAIRSGTPSGPYNLLPVQSLLKVACGAATAVMAVKILNTISAGTPATPRDSMYAIVFGFSQQAFTHLIDRQAGVLSQSPNARNGGASTSSTASGIGQTTT